MRYSIILTNHMRMYTAYNGTSFTGAQKAVDAARATLILGNGSGTISVSYNGGYLSTVWTVTDGHAALQTPFAETPAQAAPVAPVEVPQAAPAPVDDNNGNAPLFPDEAPEGSKALPAAVLARLASDEADIRALREAAAPAPQKYLYAPIYRPAAFSGIPKGWDYVEAPPDLAHKRPDIPMSGRTHGVIAYDRQLTADEVKQHELEYLGTR